MTFKPRQPVKVRKSPAKIKFAAVKQHPRRVKLADRTCPVCLRQIPATERPVVLVISGVQRLAHKKCAERVVGRTPSN